MRNVSKLQFSSVLAVNHWIIAGETYWRCWCSWRGTGRSLLSHCTLAIMWQSSRWIIISAITFNYLITIMPQWWDDDAMEILAAKQQTWRRVDKKLFIITLSSQLSFYIYQQVKLLARCKKYTWTHSPCRTDIHNSCAVIYTQANTCGPCAWL